MKMENERQIWSGDNETKQVYVVYESAIIFYGYFSKEKARSVDKSLSNGEVPSGLMSMPIEYLSSIELDEQQNFIELHRDKKNSDHVVIKDTNLKVQIFEFLSSNLKAIEVKTYERDLLTRVRKPLIGLVVLTILASFVFYNLSQLAAGQEFVFEEVGRRPSVIMTSMYALVNLGWTFNVIAFSLVYLVAGFRLKKRIQAIGPIRVIQLKK